MSERVTVDVRDGVADVRLNRPEKMNALDPAMFEALGAAGRRLDDDATIRAVVLSGNGRAFCAGLDFESFRGMGSSGADNGDDDSVVDAPERTREEPANRAQAAAWVWHRLSVPVIAAVHGVAFGGGLQIASGADLRLVAPDTRLSIMEIRWGLIPDMAGTQLWKRSVRQDVLAELTFTGREISGSEAVELGLATRACEDPLEAALELAASIAERSPHAIRAAKRLLEAARSLEPLEGLTLETELQRELIGSPNQLEAVKANFEKRTPSFVDP